MPQRFDLPIKQILGSICLLLAIVSGAPAQDAADFFRQNCISCHTIGGGRLTGPDLKGVGQRKDHGWLVDFLVLLALASLAYRVTLAHKMVTQYPWLYERAGLFSWRPKTP